MVAHIDVIGVIDQVDNGGVNDLILESLQYWSFQGKLIVVNSRNRIGLFHGLIVKTNEIEVMRSINKNSSLIQESQHEIVTAGFNCRIKWANPAVFF
ncbi:hypothetical protein [Paenibacillus foliorum]|nr:hypothetical protein [Paenibacillus foliorum]